jgi:hypothetical protein
VNGKENPSTGFTLQYEVVGNGSESVSLVSKNFIRFKD